MTEENANRAAALIAVMANAMRIRMVEIMLEGELQVSDLAERIGLSNSATSQHLRKFKMTGLLVQRRDEQRRYCAIALKWVKTLQALISIAEAHPVDRLGGRQRP